MAAPVGVRDSAGTRPSPAASAKGRAIYQPGNRSKPAAGTYPLATLFSDARTWLADAVVPARADWIGRDAMARRRPDGTAVARAAVYAPDERQAMLLLLLPFLLMAAAIGINQSVRYVASLPDIASAPAVDASRARPLEQARPADRAPAPLAEAIRAAPRIDVSPSAGAPALAPSAAPGIVTAEAAPRTSAPAVPRAPAIGSVTAPEPSLPAVGDAPSRLAASGAAPAAVPTTPTAPPAAAVAGGPAQLAESSDKTIVIAALPQLPAAVASPATAAPATTASAATGAPAPVRSLAAPDGGILALPPSALAPPLAGLELPEDGETGRRAAFYPPGGICPAPTGGWGARTASLAPPMPPVDTVDGAAFGRRLAAAARSQLSEMVVYTDQYRRISYPMGDVAPLYGVCTDVVIRAYRALGLDLQALVHVSRVGSGDTSIDHRRVETLRRFFAANGQSLPITDFAEDYQPGDIVSYYRPQNAHSRSHIALVSDVVGPSGRLMIIHNRGWGPQLEDGLFVDEITGHYRYWGLREPAKSSTQPTLSAAASPQPKAAAQPAAVRHAVPARLNASGRTGTENARPAPSQRREAASGGLVVAR